MLAPATTRAEIEAALFGYLTTRFPALTACNLDTPLLEDGTIDSLGILELMTFLGERFGITVDDTDFEPENLETPARLVRFVERKLG